ncbi:hypothetical protein Tco_0557541, partial [Tanacetum coccineum]
ARASLTTTGAPAVALGCLSGRMATQAHVSSISTQIYNLTSLAISIIRSSGEITVNPPSISAVGSLKFPANQGTNCPLEI